MYHIESHMPASPASFNSSSAMSIPQSVFAQLSQASESRQWIFFTAECPRPTYGECLHYAVDVDKVMQLKASHQYSELEVVTRALQARSASAIVTSGRFSTVERHCLQSLAADQGCHLVFLNDLQLHTPHMDRIH
ncbi:superfamily II DNA and RNA helicase [Vibrio astriarenae]|nr:superfamily II DNA and RNA helicase [Vibrio sp. C7]